jgi:hypothetical protein
MSDTQRPPVSHEEAFEHIGALALGALDSTEVTELMDHIATCAVCRDELSEMRTLVAAMPEQPIDGVMSAERSRAIRDSLVARAESVKAKPAAPNSWRLFAIAATVALAVLGAAFYRERGLASSLSREVAARAALVDSLARVVQAKDDQLAGMIGPGVSVVELTSSAVQAPSARMFWDRATNKWTMYAHGLQKLEPGRAYELWLVTADAKIPAGTFKPSSDGSAVFSATYALQPAELKAIAVTEEPEAGVPAPTGAIILLGSASAP